MSNLILNYNYNSVPRLFKNGAENQIARYLSENDSKHIFNQYEKFGLNNYPFIDRTEKIKHYLNVANLNPIPQYDSTFNKSFEELVIERIKEISSLGKKMKICWSGGLDSTYILMMMKHFVNVDQIIVYANYASIVESGQVFDKFIKNTFNCELTVFPDVTDKNYSEDCLWVTGFPSNQLFGPEDEGCDNDNLNKRIFKRLGQAKDLYEPYEKSLTDDFLEFFEPMIKSSPKKIETLVDLRWYLQFNTSWNMAVYDFKNELSIEKIKNVYNFFDTIDFQKWAITTKEPFTKIIGNPNTHRWQMRERLADFGLKEYSITKTKKESTLTINTNTWLFMLSNYRNVYNV